MSTTCKNPRCTCSPCTCGDCRCGTVKLGHLEARVMDIVWGASGHELTGREVADGLPGYAYTTVATVLDRLSHKGILRRRLDGRTARFSATSTRGAHTATLMSEALRASGDPDLALASFAASVSSSEAEVLRRALDETRNRQRQPAR